MLDQIRILKLDNCEFGGFILTKVVRYQEPLEGGIAPMSSRQHKVSLL
jgi:hypothetical protein